MPDAEDAVSPQFQPEYRALRELLEADGSAAFLDLPRQRGVGGVAVGPEHVQHGRKALLGGGKEQVLHGKADLVAPQAAERR